MNILASSNNPTIIPIRPTIFPFIPLLPLVVSSLRNPFFSFPYAHPSFCPSVFLCQSFLPSFLPSLYTSFRTSIRPSFHPSVHLSLRKDYPNFLDLVYSLYIWPALLDAFRTSFCPSVFRVSILMS